MILLYKDYIRFSIPLSYPSVYWELYFRKVNCTSNLTYLERSSELDIFGMILYFLPKEVTYDNVFGKLHCMMCRI